MPSSNETRLVAMTSEQVQRLAWLAEFADEREAKQALIGFKSSADDWHEDARALRALADAFDSGLTSEEARALRECVGYALGNGMSKPIDSDAAIKLTKVFDLDLSSEGTSE